MNRLLFPLASLVIIGQLSFLLASETAFAHAKVKSNEPAIGEAVEGKLDQLTLRFSKSVVLMDLTLTPFDAVETLDKKTKLDPDQAVTFTNKLPKKAEKTISVQFETLPAGTWAYTWRALAKDGHLMKGFGHFVVLP